MNYQLLCCGDANALKTWSNIPYFLLKAGIQQDIFDNGISLHPERLNIYKPFWNIIQFLHSGYVGGFQYSHFFLDRLWSQYLNSIDFSRQPLKLLSHFPLLPCHPWPSGWSVSFYIDATIKQVFDDYRAGLRISPRYQAQIIQREAAAYHRADSVITMSTWAAESVLSDYKVPASRIHVVPGGANLDVSGLIPLLPSSLPPPPSQLQPLRLGFLGKEWIRKGGPFVLKVAEKLDMFGIPAVVRAIGPEPSKLPISKHLKPLGFIDKNSMQAQFINELSSWHFGTLFSSAEAFGISNRECSLLGVPVLAYPNGGIPSTFTLTECGKLFSTDSTPESVATWIANRIKNYDRYLADRSQLLKMSDIFSWKHTTAQLKKILR